MKPSLLRGLSLVDALSLVIGTIIGTGVFLKTANMTHLVGSQNMVLLAWTVAGVLSLIGALVYAELGALFPRAGGEYEYLREAYGDLVAFLYGWQRCFIGSPGSIAAYAVGSATFFSGITALSGGQKTALALGFIWAFSLLNCLAVKVGGAAQAALTGLKVALIFGMILGIFFYTGGADPSAPSTIDGMGFSLSAFGLAVLAALWAFDGWNNLPMAAGEVQNPGRNIPIALIVGVVLVFVIYASVNVAYFHALSLEEVLSANSRAHPDALPVATLAAKKVWGESGGLFLAIAMTISALGAMNGSVLTGSRVPYAMAAARALPQKLAELSRYSVPYNSVLLQGVVASCLAMSGTFDQLTDWVVFSSWIFYALCGLAVIVFRKKMPAAERSYKVPLYPVLPIVFFLMALALLVNTVISSPKESGFGLLLIASGVPYFYWQRRQRAKA